MVMSGAVVGWVLGATLSNLIVAGGYVAAVYGNECDPGYESVCDHKIDDAIFVTSAAYIDGGVLLVCARERRERNACDVVSRGLNLRDGRGTESEWRVLRTPNESVRSAVSETPEPTSLNAKSCRARPLDAPPLCIHS